MGGFGVIFDDIGDLLFLCLCLYIVYIQLLSYFQMLFLIARRGYIYILRNGNSYSISEIGAIKCGYILMKFYCLF